MIVTTKSLGNFVTKCDRQFARTTQFHADSSSTNRLEKLSGWLRY